MSRVHPVFGISLEETAPAFPTSRHDSGAAGTNAASVSTEFLESESHTDVASAPFSGDASTFGGPAKSPGRPEDVAAPPQDGSWGPLRLPTPPTEVSEPAPVPASMLELVRTTDRTLIAIIALVGGVLILFVLNQAVAFIDHLAQSPAWAQWIGGTALLVALAAIVGSMWSLAQRYWQLKQTPAVCLQRRQLHELVCSNTTQAKHKLEELLREFPIDRDPSDKWKRLGFTPPSLLDDKNHMNQ